MSIWNNWRLAAIAAVIALPLVGQDKPLDPANSVKIDLQPDSPLALISMSMGDYRASTRGGAMVLDLHMALTLRNSGFKRVRGVTLLITSQEFAPGGKGSVARPCIDVSPGENFTLPVDIRLVRPVQQTAGPLVRVQLDGILFDDLSFFGPNKLNSQRAMTFWEVEAQRDRAFFKRALQANGETGLRREILGSLTRQSNQVPLDVAVSRHGRATGPAASPSIPTSEHVA